ncbi:MAG TPA: FAD-dependent oxidoreductase [Dehalococcoidia bacterium]|nr:FAD-dependent oxidoreductase [Dehalococcoidia bacterium]
MRDYDVVVIGAGLAGLTAAMTAAKHGLSTAVVDQMGAGGQVLNVEKIENLPGFPEGIAGYDLGPIVQEQAEAAGAEFYLDSVESLDLEGVLRIVRGAEEELRAPTVIIAAGSSLRNLGIPGEERLTGHGVSHCASCDGPFFAGNSVAVVGGGDSAIEEAAVLTNHVERVLVFHNGESLGAQQTLINAVEGKPSIEFYYNSEVEEILGENGVTALKVRDKTTGESREEAVAGVFVYVGLEPNTSFLQGVVDLDAGGHIVTDVMMRTSLPGVFAAGDIRQSSVSLVSSVMGDGATAAVAAYRYIYGL